MIKFRLFILPIITSLIKVIIQFIPFIVMGILLFVLCIRPTANFFSNLIGEASAKIDNILPTVIDARQHSFDSNVKLDSVLKVTNRLTHLSEVLNNKTSIIQKLTERAVLSKPQTIILADSFFFTKVETLFLPVYIEYNPRYGKYRWTAVKRDSGGTVIGVDSGGRIGWYKPVKFIAKRDGIEVKYPRFPFHSSYSGTVLYEPMGSKIEGRLGGGIYIDRFFLLGELSIDVNTDSVLSNLMDIKNRGKAKVGIGYFFLN